MGWVERREIHLLLAAREFGLAGTSRTFRGHWLRAAAAGRHPLLGFRIASGGAPLTV